jgi:predicted ATP-dependent endonuclease of OLD family
MDIKERAILCYHYGLLEKPEEMLNAIRGLNAYRSFAFLKKGFFEAFYVIDVNEDEDEMIDWLTYSLSKEASSYKFLSEFKKVDQLLAEYQNSLKKINELSELLRERDRKIEQLESKYGAIENSSILNIVYAFYKKIRDIIMPHR